MAERVGARDRLYTALIFRLENPDRILMSTQAIVWALDGLLTASMLPTMAIENTHRGSLDMTGPCSRSAAGQLLHIGIADRDTYKPERCLWSLAARVGRLGGSLGTRPCGFVRLPWRK